MPPNPMKTSLRDGTSVLIRPVGPDDRHLLEVAFAHLSKQSRYFRFLYPVNQLSKQQLDQFTEGLHRDHVALGALDVSQPEPVPVGLARYERLQAQPEMAEFAVTVVDSHQKRGLGSLLIGALAALAVTNDIKEFVGFVHGDNGTMIRLLKALGATQRNTDAGVVELLIPLYVDAELYPVTPAGLSIRQAYKLTHASADALPPGGDTYI
ncbi:GNAT family N-acetyltransferase [Limibacillus sp. MBR-115]|jgi:RimJ/RimL family protein N-acetyltransferase|uniref:GNAT family N-acetyltransferase n=1 Tax=Limibacillus sp. MBR-115 TaxID=3156465 RepID=UPI00339B6073